MSDLWKHLSTLSKEQTEQIIAMTVGKILKDEAKNYPLDASIRKLFEQLVSNKIDTDEIKMDRWILLDQDWIVEMIKKFIVEQNHKEGFGV